ncbi:uncharacterized protein LTR77_007880 [Saxophila tyrrhenica]|uniref:AB hydrolase-1 domain-containing protein n=1 Tax=Saxophila tyrrhenica TaxID=1690608 RepID=A0AAV9P758_9PEZI|nr:hypothetical protein LTR77_007880 [Saxophila tyrrhenica]
MPISAGRVFGFIEGVLSLIILAILSYLDKSSNPSNDELGEEVAKGTWNDPALLELSSSNAAIAQDDLWSLDVREGDIVHKLLTLPDGLQLHYISPAKAEQRRDLIIFLHGFPDSCFVWSRMLRSSLSEHATLVALDLPGYGGSDGLPNYGPDCMLSAIEVAIKELKQQYGVNGAPKSNESRCIVVGHDWGGAIASRVAAETEGLIDHLVLINSVFPPHAAGMVKGRIDRARQLVSSRPQGWLRSARDEIGCVGSQLLKSHYIFLFNLPFFSARRFPSIMRYLLNWCYKKASKHDGSLSSTYAASLGPSVAQCHEEASKSVYSASVLARAMAQPDAIWDERIRLYRERLASGRWTRASNSAHSPALPGRRYIRCPSTVLFGIRDEALDPSIFMEGIDDYVRPTSGYKGLAVSIQGVGHWSPLHPLGADVLEQVLTSHITATKSGVKQLETVKDRLQGSSVLHKVSVREMK